jgi:hypothetical protein
MRLRGVGVAGRAPPPPLFDVAVTAALGEPFFARRPSGHGQAKKPQGVERGSFEKMTILPVPIFFSSSFKNKKTPRTNLFISYQTPSYPY